jgi:hypothetical protein
MGATIALGLDRTEDLQPWREIDGGWASIAGDSVPDAVEMAVAPGEVARMKFRYPSQEPPTGSWLALGDVQLLPGSDTGKVMELRFPKGAPDEDGLNRVARQLEQAASDPEMYLARAFSYQMVAAVLKHWGKQIARGFRPGE